jgi:hypothetical protein
MTARTRVSGSPGVILAVTLAFIGLIGSPIAGLTTPTPVAAAESALPRWTGGVDLYRAGTFTTQRSWLWCTAAGVQIARNIVDHERDHSTTSQRRYFEWMRQHNRYDLPLSAGVDAQGWAAGMRHFVDSRYRLVSSGSFDSALRSAVERMRRTNLPVAITVSHGNHGWLLVGFRATADPARTDRYTVTSVRVVGPLFGLQSRNGYDMPPNTRLTPTQLRRFFTPWHYDPKPMIWDGRYISIQPIPRNAAVQAAPKPKPTPKPTVVAQPAVNATVPVRVASALGILAEGLAGPEDAAAGAVEAAAGAATFVGADGAVEGAVDVKPASAPPVDSPEASSSAEPATDQTALFAFFLISLPIAAVAAAMLGPWRRRPGRTS